MHSRFSDSAVANARTIDGMVRFPEGKNMPWRADRLGIALYDTFAQDGRFDRKARTAAASTSDAIASTILAHRESDDFVPFNDADYSNAYGPTVRFPVTPKQIDIAGLRKSWRPTPR